jgi:hypothetical protein
MGTGKKTPPFTMIPMALIMVMLAAIGAVN